MCLGGVSGRARSSIRRGELFVVRIGLWLAMAFCSWPQPLVRHFRKAFVVLREQIEPKRGSRECEEGSGRGARLFEEAEGGGNGSGNTPKEGAGS